MDRLEDLDFPLPERLIAQTPLDDRAASRLLHLSRAGEVEHRQFRDVPFLLREGDLLVLNDSRVDALRLRGRRPSGGAVETLLVERLGPFLFEALLRPSKRLRVGEVIAFEGCTATVEEVRNERRVLRFDREPTVGETPLPPYIHVHLKDAERYQTVYAADPGSAAAPTAGLHFTPELLSQLEAQGVVIARVTLHVGIDTFRPITADLLDDHAMHGERATVPEETARLVRECKGRIVAVGTTSVRTLEAFATGPRLVEAGTRRIDPFIRPGWNWRIVDGMFTNFHLPKTTMLLMLAALVGRDALFSAYEEAVKEEYRWASFGDSMLIL